MFDRNTLTDAMIAYANARVQYALTGDEADLDKITESFIAFGILLEQAEQNA